MNYEEFRTERTKLISEMFDNVDKTGIYPTSIFFEGIDKIFLEQEQQIGELKDKLDLSDRTICKVKQALK